MTPLSRACVSPYYYSIVTMSVYRTVSHNSTSSNGVTLNSWLGDFNWLLKVTPVNRIYETFYHSAIVAIALGRVSFSSYLTLNNVVTLKSRLDVTRGFAHIR